MPPRLFALLALLVPFLLTGCGSSEPPALPAAASDATAPDATGPDTTGPDGQAPTDMVSTVKRIAVIPGGTTHAFWKAVEKGARTAGTELGVEVLWQAPLTGNDRAEQIRIVRQFVARGVDGIVLAPLDRRALVAPVRESMRAKIPVVIVDSVLDGTPGTDFVSVVATDNRLGGRMAGDHLAELLSRDGGKGRQVVLLRPRARSASTDHRDGGFLQAIAAHPGLVVTVDDLHAGATAGQAKTAALDAIDRLREADGIFCSNESATLGCLLALRQEGLAGKVRFVGFGASPPLVKALRNREIDALVVQDPRSMGYKAVEAMITHLEGFAVRPVIGIGAVLVTRNTMTDPELARLLE